MAFGPLPYLPFSHFTACSQARAADYCEPRPSFLVTCDETNGLYVIDVRPRVASSASVAMPFAAC